MLGERCAQPKREPRPKPSVPPRLLNGFASALPLALENGTGSELRFPLGVTIIGGLLLSQVLTLYTTPVIYIFFDRIAQRISGKRPSSQAAQHAGTPHPEESTL